MRSLLQYVSSPMALAMRKLIFSFISVLFVTSSFAQQRLTLEDAIARALKKNYDISIAELASEQAARNNTLGNAGFSPTISAGGSYSGSKANVLNDLANGTQQVNPNATNKSLNPALSASWTIFDGGRMFLVKKQLNELEVLGNLQLQAQMQLVVSRTIQTYARAVLQQKQRYAADTALRLATTRMQLANLKFTNGSGAKVDYLQARVDYSARQADSLTYLSQFADACDSLSVLMGERDNNLYIVDDTIIANMNLQGMDQDHLRDFNLSLQSYKTSAAISQTNADIAKTYFLPTVTLTGSYYYTRTNSATGFALFSRSYGANGAVNLSVPLFQGGNVRRQSKVASLQAMRDELAYERENSIIGRQYRTAWRNYKLAVAAYYLALENIKFARENLDVQVARFRVGVGTTLESQEAENAFVDALIRLYTSQFNVKTYETQVLELENKLVKRQ